LDFSEKNAERGFFYNAVQTVWPFFPLCTKIIYIGGVCIQGLKFSLANLLGVVKSQDLPSLKTANSWRSPFSRGLNYLHK
jgi:hypothetical protein